MVETMEGSVFERWDTLPARYRYMAFAALAMLAALAVGASDMRFATPAWVIAFLGGAFLCIYAFPSVWRYLIHMGLIYGLVAAGAIMPLFYLSRAPLFIGWAFILHSFALIVAYQLVKDVVLSRRAYHVAAAKAEHKAPYVPVGLWFVTVVLFIMLTDVSMLGFSRWAQGGESLALYIGAEVVMVGLLMYILDVPERAFGGKGADFVPRVSLSDVTDETRKAVKKLVKRSVGDRIAKRSVRAAEQERRPKQLAGGTLECPACGADLAIDVRRCPECYRENEFAWCPVSEHYIIPCPRCGKPTVYGEEACSHCGQRLSLDYKCPQCMRSNPLQRWERA